LQNPILKPKKISNRMNRLILKVVWALAQITGSGFEFGLKPKLLCSSGMNRLRFNRVQSPTVQGTIAWFIALISLLGCLSTGAESGNLAFEKQNFEEAAEIYQREIDEKGSHANLLFNLGNAHYQLGKYGAAIYDYERALVLAPRASDIRNNLARARKSAAAYEEENSSAKRWLKLLNWFSINGSGSVGLPFLYWRWPVSPGRPAGWRSCPFRHPCGAPLPWLGSC
jgi:tetratricopeptide (TPR) repeat protein